MKAHPLPNPWQRALASLPVKEAIAALCTVGPSEQTGLRHQSATIATERLREAWTKMYLPDQTHLKLIDELLDRARSSASKRFPDEDFYVKARYSRDIPLPDEQLWCVSGLAGISKSATMAAITRVFKTVVPPGSFAIVGNAEPAFVVHLKLRTARSVCHVLESLANPLFMAGRAKVSLDDLTDHLREWLYSKSTILLLVDELQFVSTSSKASTLIASTISALAELGPPVVYICNYSLARKLMRRPHEEKARFLSQVTVLHPPNEDDPHWAHVVESYLSVAKSYFDFKAEQVAPELHRLTSGMYRALKDLLCEACRHAWQNGTGRPVTMNDVRSAYRSDGYTSHRGDVETLARVASSAQARRARPDLVSPFSSTIDRTSATTSDRAPRKPLELSPIVQETFESAMHPEGRKVLKQLREAAAAAPPERKSSANVKSIRKRGPVTSTSLLANLSLIGYRVVPPGDDDDK